MRVLLIASLVFAALSLTGLFKAYLASEGLIVPPGKPFGGDFVNLWTTARLLLSGMPDDVYRVASFDAFQETLTGRDIGLRLWAYPPHSLIFVWPFGFYHYHLAFIVWTLLGSAVLLAGARYVGLNPVQTGILMLSPASMQCIADGQTGSLAIGLLLFAVAARPSRTTSSTLAAAILTVKPQVGFLLPVLWLVERRWKLILATGAVTSVLLIASAMVYGLQPWTDYLGDTLPKLSLLEQQGTGPFLYMIPSVFISMRLLGAGADTASAFHVVCAGLAFLLLVWRLFHIADARGRAALVLIGTCLVTPYLHLYDLSIVLAGALLLLPSGADDLPALQHKPALAAIGGAWLLPILVGPLGAAGLPASPAIILAIFLVACFPSDSGRPGDWPSKQRLTAS